MAHRRSIFAFVMVTLTVLIFCCRQFTQLPEGKDQYFTYRGDSRATIYGRVQAKDGSLFPESMPLRIERISLDRQLLAAGGRVCLRDIWADATTMTSTEPRGLSALFVYSLTPTRTEPVCVDSKANQDIKIDWDIAFPTGRSNLRSYHNYPFDDLLIEAETSLQLLLYRDGEDFPIEMNIVRPNQQLSIDVKGREVSDARLEQTPGIQLKLVRPGMLKWTVVILGVLMFCAIGAMFLITEFNTVIEVAVALILGLAGIRPIVIQGETPGFIAIDTAFLTAYVAIVVVVTLHYLVQKPRRARHGPHALPSEHSSHVAEPRSQTPPSWESSISPKNKPSKGQPQKNRRGRK